MGTERCADMLECCMYIKMSYSCCLYYNMHGPFACLDVILKKEKVHEIDRQI
jgi:hypothetical protein